MCARSKGPSDLKVLPGALHSPGLAHGIPSLSMPALAKAGMACLEYKSAKVSIMMI